MAITEDTWSWKMPFVDNLICERVDYLDEQIKQLDIITPWYPDYTDATYNKRFSTGLLKLANNTNIMLYEEYDIIDYKLKISHYCYRFHDSNGQEIFRADNSEHHDVPTAPHHIHDFRFGDTKPKPFYGQESDNPDITEFFAQIQGERR
jgi:hypothetical protein